MNEHDTGVMRALDNLIHASEDHDEVQAQWQRFLRTFRAARRQQDRDLAPPAPRGNVVRPGRKR